MSDEWTKLWNWKWSNSKSLKVSFNVDSFFSLSLVNLTTFNFDGVFTLHTWRCVAIKSLKFSLLYSHLAWKWKCIIKINGNLSNENVLRISHPPLIRIYIYILESAVNFSFPHSTVEKGHHFELFTFLHSMKHVILCIIKMGFYTFLMLVTPKRYFWVRL